MIATAPEARDAAGLRTDALRSAALNAVNVLLGTVTGLAAARILGAEGRGVYAAVITWYIIVKVLFELGLPVAVTYRVAQDPATARQCLRLASRSMLVSSLLAMAGAAVVAVLVLDDPVAVPTAIAFLGLAVAAWGNARLAVLQAIDNARWNVGRVVQPSAYLVLVLLVASADEATPAEFFWCLFASLALSTVVIAVLLRPVLPAGRSDRPVTGLHAYAARALGSTFPNVTNARVDQLALSLTGDFGALGSYALAVALVTLVLPLAMGVGSALLPHLAAGRGRSASRRSVGLALLTTGAASALVLAVVVPLGGVLVPRVFGAGFESVGVLLLLLAPGAWAGGLALVASNALNGLGAPGRGARVEIGTTVLLVAGLLLAVPSQGAAGAAVASSAVGVLRFLWFCGELRTALRDLPVPADADADAPRRVGPDSTDAAGSWPP